MNRQVPNPKANKNILFITYLVVAAFACMIGYFGYFLQFRGETVINNSYNARLDRFADRIVRGELQSGDGRVLARTEAVGNSEHRSYPYGEVIALVVG